MSTAGTTTHEGAGTGPQPGGSRDRTRALDALGLVLRLVLGGVVLVAGLLKVDELQASARAVQAYRVLPYEVGQWVGYGLPIAEVIIGGLLVLGLFTRTNAAVATLLMLLFTAGIAQAWARGLSIDCGCFGGGGPISAAEATAKYPWEIARDVALALCGLWLVRRPRSLFSLDRALFGA